MTRLWSRSMGSLFALAVAGCAGAPAPDAVGVWRQGEPVPGGALVSDKGATLVSDKGATLVANNAGSFTGVVKGPSAEAITRVGALVANGSAGLVANNAAGLVANSAASYHVRALSGMAPVASAHVTVTDAAGRPLTDAPVTTDAEGRFSIPRIAPSGAVVFVVATYEAGGKQVSLQAAAEAPRAAGDHATELDPVSTVVGSQVARWAQAGTLTEQASTSAAWRTLGDRLAADLDEADAVAASTGGADAVYLRTYSEDAALRAAVEALALPAAPAPAPGPAPEVSVLAGTGAAGFADGAAATAAFQFPYAVAAEADGGVVVADYRNHRIRRVSADGTVSTVAGGEAGFADGARDAARFSGPRGVAVAPDGAILVADTGNARIRRIAPDGTVSTLAGTGTAGFADGAGDHAQFSEPRGVAVDAQGVVYVADTGNARVRSVSPGGAVSTLCDLTLPEGQARPSEAQLAGPYGVAVGPTGTVYVADASRNAVLRVEGHGALLVAGGPWGDADGTGSTAGFRSPVAIAVDPSGALYVADCFNHRLRRIGTDGAVTTVAGAGTSGAANGDRAHAQFYGPYGLAFSGPHRLVVADTSNHTLRAVTLP